MLSDSDRSTFLLAHPNLCGLVLATTASVALAHHSDAGYDRDTIVAFEGTVERYVWRNPHVQIYATAENDNGQRVEWEIETGSTPIMMRSGWTRELLEPGDTVSIRLHPERTGRARGILNVMETTDGRSWSQIESDAQATGAAASIAGVWKGLGSSSLNRQLANAKLTPAAVAAQSGYDDIEHRARNACLPNPPPLHIASPVYLSGIEVLDDRVILRNEIYDVARTVWTDGRGHPADGEPTNQGHSIGHWEGESLVVDTTLFTPHPIGNGRSGVPSGPRKHLVERYSLNNERTRLIVDVTLDDSDYLAEPFSGRVELVYQPNLQLYRYDCDPEAMQLR